MCELNYKRSRGAISGMRQHDRTPCIEAIMTENWQNRRSLNHRLSYRMQGYDYSLAGAYFVTVATYHHISIFGDVMDSKVRLNSYGEIAQDEWFRSATLRPLIKLFDDEFIVMPNHIHGIIHIVESSPNSRGAALLRPYYKHKILPDSLGALVRAYKSSVTYRINQLRGDTNPPIWQRNYYDHIIRNDAEYQNIWDYIETNPDHWRGDQFDPYPDFTNVKLHPA
jgi:putative transposase